MKHLFFGGIHPEEKKELSAGKPLVTKMEPGQVSILMSQHIGVPCEPLVKAGDMVRKGQKIGDGEGMCVPVHASVSGRVIAVEPRRHPSGQEITAVVIENDFLDTPDTAMTAHKDYSSLSNEEIIAIIREAGIAGMGGATFSTTIKAASAMGKADTLIANACECEPYLTADDILLRTSPEEVLEGMRIICQVLQPERAVLAIEENKTEAIGVIRPLLEKEKKITLKILPARFPQGAEKQLVQSVTGREIAPGELPISAGCVVFNAGTLRAIYRAVVLGQALTERIVTVTGEGVNNPGNFYARIGTSYEDMLKAAGGLREETKKVITGGPMMGYAQGDLSVSIIKGTNGILGLLEENGDKDDYACIRCGKCLTVCPMKLQPLHLFEQAEQRSVEGLKHYYLMDCIECGCCSYECPGKVPLTARFKEAKQLVREAGK
ncbi:MAG: electron transport complex subunit RsxC [Lachnospiraceae bacterium]|nr:electron transport complex subunit RsxC [Lachnospiraceae bacterium]MDD7049849.1 electron transport complex subunit RsxC [Lachnospiraceae bacterium]MDY4096411.1 electron transport complex subunit RsxC [Lachnospiraceae bacterium]